MSTTAKRDIIGEILEKYSRSETRRGIVSSRLSKIELTMAQIDSAFCDTEADELYRHIPVATVACLEWYYRLVYKELIDHGSPYVDNIEAFRWLKFDFQISKAIQGLSITLGDFVSHMLPLSSINNLVANMDIILGRSFKKELRKHQSIWDADSVQDQEIADDVFTDIFTDIHTLFELRHQFCHEIGNENIDKALIKKCFRKVGVLIMATNVLVDDLLFKDVPKNQSEINLQISQDLENQELSLREALKEASLHIPKGQEELFYSSQLQWEEYRDAYSELRASFYEGGTLQPAIYGWTKLEITASRVKELRELIKV